MISEQTKLAIERLTKGAKRLSEAELRSVLQDVKDHEVDEVVRHVFAPNPKAAKLKPEVPVWLKSMDSAKKRISWKTPEAIDRLYGLAEVNGFVSTKRKTTFPSAAKEIALQLGEQQICEVFVDWVDEFVAKHKMV